MSDAAAEVDGPPDETATESYSRRLTRLADEIGDRPVITLKTVAGTGTASDEVITFAEFDRRTNQMGRHLTALGATHGGFVTIAEPNSIEFLVAVAACWKIGAIPQPVSSRLPPLEIEAIVDLADPQVVVGVEHAGRASVPLGFVPGADIDDSLLPDTVSPAWKAPTSGGSTGRPKLIVSGDPSQILASVTSIGAGIGAVRDAVMVMPGPLYHNGPFIWTCQTILSGGQVILLPRFDAEGTLAAIQDHRGTALYLVPTMMQRMWKLPDDVKFDYDLSSLQRAVHLAEPCPEWLKDVWLDWIGPEVLYELYGGTEGQSATLLSGTEWLAHRGSVGKPISGEMVIMDDDGTILPPGEVGDVWMRPVGRETPTYRYIGDEPETRGDGWECLGDIGWMDEDGYLYLADRRKDMILVGGANVYPAEIEAAINAHSKVSSCAVIGLPDEEKGSRIHAIVEPARVNDDEQSITDDELLAFLSERLVRYKMPRTFEYVTEPLRDDAGKVRRGALAAERLAAMEHATSTAASGD